MISKARRGVITLSDSKPRTATRAIRHLRPVPILAPKPTSHLVNTVNVVKEAVPKSVKKQVVAPELSATMRRILEQYRAGTYAVDDYSTRTVQRHRKFFMARGIDLRTPFVAKQPMRSKIAKSLGKKSTCQIAPVSARRIGSTRCIKTVSKQKVKAHHE